MKSCFALLAALAWASPVRAAEPSTQDADDAEGTPKTAPERVAPSAAVVPAGAPNPSASAEVAPAPATPRRETLTLELGTRTLFVQDDAYGIFSKRRSLPVGGFALRAPLFRDDAWTYAAGLSLEGKDGVQGDVRSLPASFDLFRVVARGEVSYAAYRYLTAYGSIGVGAESLEFRYGDAAQNATSKSWSPAGEVGVGVGTHAQLGWARLGLRVDGGYTAAKSHALRVTLPEVGDVVRQPIDLGTLGTSAPFVRVAIQLGF